MTPLGTDILPLTSGKSMQEDSVPLMRIDLFVLAFCLTFMQLPMLIEIKGIGKLSILPFVFVILKNMFLLPALSYRWAQFINLRFKDIFRGNGTFTILIVLTLVVVIADLRSLFAGASSFGEVVGNLQRYILLFLFFLSIWLTTPNQNIHHILLALLMSPGVLVLVNLILFAVGVGNQAADDVRASGLQSSLLSIIGISSPRVVFPLTNGINGFGSLAGMAVVIGVLGSHIKKNGYLTIFHIIATMGALIAIAMLDSRGALAAAVLTCILLILFKNIAYKHTFKIIIFSGTLPFLILLVLPYLPISDAINMVSRQSSFDAGHALLTGRPLVWDAAWRELSQLMPLHFIGFGTHGQSISGVSSYYGYQIGGGRHALRMHLHNFDLQTIFDIGYFGLGLVFLLLWRLIDVCRSIIIKFGFLGYILLAFFIYGGLQGATEAVPSHSYLEMYWLYASMIVFLTLGASVFKIQEKDSHGRTSRH
ncbi:MAG: hypothetical protein H7252_05945 [Cytophaga sp.]|nr:hypothetical protein [Undibacterium sp.]